MFFFHDQYIPHIWELYFIYRSYCLTLFLFYMFIRNQIQKSANITIILIFFLKLPANSQIIKLSVLKFA